MCASINFFKNNPIKIETLTNKEISEELGLHPSTISRILRNKYIDTPKGIMPLKSLMVSSVSKSRNITSIHLMNLIKDISGSFEAISVLYSHQERKLFNIHRFTISILGFVECTQTKDNLEPIG